MEVIGILRILASVYPIYLLYELVAVNLEVAQTKPEFLIIIIGCVFYLAFCVYHIRRGIHEIIGDDTTNKFAHYFGMIISIIASLIGAGIIVIHFLQHTYFEGLISSSSLSCLLIVILFDIIKNKNRKRRIELLKINKRINQI